MLGLFDSWRGNRLFSPRVGCLRSDLSSDSASADAQARIGSVASTSGMISRALLNECNGDVTPTTPDDGV